VTADYQPVYLPGDAVTATASAQVTHGDLVEVSGSGTVAPVPVTPGAVPSLKVVGLASLDTAVNARVTYYARATVHESVALGTVTAGDQVGSAIAGDVPGGVRTIAPPALGGSPAGADINTELSHARAVLGVALTTATYPAKCRWMSY